MLLLPLLLLRMSVEDDAAPYAVAKDASSAAAYVAAAVGPGFAFALFASGVAA